MDGRPFRYIAGSIHYFRIPEIYWNDRLYKVKAAGLNTIQTYVPWNLHEPYPGKFRFHGIANVTRFLQLAHNLQLYVILRPGPYVCAEWENGGLPWWLVNEPGMRMRTSDLRFLARVKSWLAELMPRIEPFLYKNGGPIISVQVENEYGSFNACDRAYMTTLTTLLRQYVGPETVLFTTDGYSMRMLLCGTVPGAYPTVDFGPMNFDAVQKAFEMQRIFAPRGPLVNSEYYPGWFDQWGRNHSVTTIQQTLDAIESMWIMNASFNIYLFHGGTNFGFMNGASAGKMPVTTSYDYDAPISEAGDITVKYLAIKAQIEKLTGKPNLYPIPSASRKAAYGQLTLRLIGTIPSLLEVISPMERLSAKDPLTFESLNWPYGYILYQTQTANLDGKQLLTVSGLKDRAYVMVDDNIQAILNGIGKETISTVLTLEIGSDLKILVENLGRENFGYNDCKGLTGNVTLGGKALQRWTHYRINIESLFDPETLHEVRDNRRFMKGRYFTPSVYAADFILNSIPEDTFFYPKGWAKGQLYLNGRNVGRYWPKLGPQVTLYVPKNFLKPAHNRMVILEFESPGQCTDSWLSFCSVEFIDKPILDKQA